MSGITTNVGLVSGLPTGEIIDQLMDLERRPLRQVEQRKDKLEVQLDAFGQIGAALRGLMGNAGSLGDARAFLEKMAGTSNEGVATATAGRSAQTGVHEFIVDRLAGAQKSMSRGFRDAGESTVGAGTLSFQRGEAALEADTQLSVLNGGQGVERGVIEITDRAGNAATVDLSRAVSVNEVLEKINNAAGIDVRAEVVGDGLAIHDLNAGATGTLSVISRGGRETAEGLGIAGATGDATLNGSAVNRVGMDTVLADLNDRLGVATVRGEEDMRITVGGASYELNLDDAQTLGDVVEMINALSDDVEAGIGGDGVSLSVSATDGGEVEIESLNDSQALRGLGLLRESDGAARTSTGGTIEGERVVAGLNSRLLGHLNGGQGIGELGEIELTDRSGASATVDLSGAHSVSEVLKRINDAGGIDVRARLNSTGNGIELRDTSGGSGQLSVADVSGDAAAGLNLAGTHEGDRVDSGNLSMQFVSEGASLDRLGIAQGRFTITDGTGVSKEFEVGDDARTIADVLRQINEADFEVHARVNDAGDGLVLEDTADVPGQGIVVGEAGSTTARDLGLMGVEVEAGEDLVGSLSVKIELAGDETLEDVRSLINGAGGQVEASIINDGSGGSPYRLMLDGKQTGSGGAFLIDDGGLDLGMQTLREASDAVVFFGTNDAARGLAIRSSENQMRGVIPGVDVSLRAASDEPVQITVEENTEVVIGNIEAFVEQFNSVFATIGEYDFYDEDSEERGPLLGDATLGTVERRLFNEINAHLGSNVGGRFNTLAEVGLTVGEGAVLEFDEERFRSAYELDSAGVRDLFTAREQAENETTGQTEVVRMGAGWRIREVLDQLTMPGNGLIASRETSLNNQIRGNEDRIEGMERRLESRREVLERQFLGMERALSQMQDQFGALMQMMGQNGGRGGGGVAGMLGGGG